MKAEQRDLSLRTQVALNHLRRLAPYDGYSAECYLASNGKWLVRLKRRNIPLRDVGFLDVVLTRQNQRIGEFEGGCIVGIQDMTSKGDVGRGLVLVRKDGSICTSNDVVTVPMANVATADVPGLGNNGDRNTKCSGPPNRPSVTRASTSSSSSAATNAFTAANNEVLLQYGLMAVGGLIFLKIIAASINILTLLFLPLAYMYALQNCPSNSSFDAKRELKRVLRGAHLPEEQQPKGIFEQGLNRLAASISTELATSLGYEVRISDYFGAAKLASIRVPVAGADYYWIGILGKWRFVGQREVESNTSD